MLAPGDAEQSETPGSAGPVGLFTCEAQTGSPVSEMRKDGDWLISSENSGAVQRQLSGARGVSPVCAECFAEMRCAAHVRVDISESK